MNKIIRVLSTSLLFSTIYCCEPPLQSITFFSPRSQSTNAARELVGWHPYIHRTCAPWFYTVWTLTPAYNHSTRPKLMANVLFGTDELAISGSFIPNRNPNDILADYFGLSPNFVSTVFINPKIRNASLTLNGYIGFDGLIPGLYFRIHAPAVWTAWELDLDEDVIQEGTETIFPAFYMSPGPVVPPIKSFTRALQGNVTFGQMQEPLAFGKVCGTQKKHGLSDLQMALGYDIVNNYLGFAGFNFRVAVPTGSRPKSEFLFEPIVGNGKHWEFGIGFSGQTLMWEKEGGQRVFLLGDVNFMHLCKARQRRSFDLKCDRYLSRYMLAKEFDADGNYDGHLVPLINHTTLECKVWMDFQMDLALMLSYVHCGFVGDVGYNGWIRTRERIELIDCFPENRFTLKGIQNVSTVGLMLNNATQSTATIFGNEFADQILVADPNPPVFIKPSDIDLKSARSPLLITHKFFAHISYGCENIWYGCMTPFIGFGGEVEFQGVNTRQRHVLHNDTMSQWGVWIKAGWAY